jgi:hypothetical protein
MSGAAGGDEELTAEERRILSALATDNSRGYQPEGGAGEPDTPPGGAAGASSPAKDGEKPAKSR